MADIHKISMHVHLSEDETETSEMVEEAVGKAAQAIAKAAHAIGLEGQVLLFAGPKSQLLGKNIGPFKVADGEEPFKDLRVEFKA